MFKRELWIPPGLSAETVKHEQEAAFEHVGGVWADHPAIAFAASLTCCRHSPMIS